MQSEEFEYFGFVSVIQTAWQSWVIIFDSPMLIPEHVLVMVNEGK